MNMHVTMPHTIKCSYSPNRSNTCQCYNTYATSSIHSQVRFPNLCSKLHRLFNTLSLDNVYCCQCKQNQNMDKELTFVYWITSHEHHSTVNSYTSIASTPICLSCEWNQLSLVTCTWPHMTQARMLGGFGRFRRTAHSLVEVRGVACICMALGHLAWP